MEANDDDVEELLTLFSLMILPSLYTLEVLLVFDTEFEVIVFVWIDSRLDDCVGLIDESECELSALLLDGLSKIVRFFMASSNWLADLMVFMINEVDLSLDESSCGIFRMAGYAVLMTAWSTAESEAVAVIFWLKRTSESFWCGFMFTVYVYLMLIVLK